MLNCEVLVRDEYGMLLPRGSKSAWDLISDIYFIATVDDFIDVIMKDHRKYIRWSVSPTIEKH